MISGAGRGRAWLNLENNVVKPGGLPSTIDPLNLKLQTTQIATYLNILKLIEQLDPEDDGILLNRKFNAILSQWKSDCSTSVEVEESFDYIYLQCRKKISLARKLVLMVSTPSFATASVSDVKIRHVFIRNVQKDFDNRIQIKASHPDEFRTSLCMLTEFYHKARSTTGISLRILAVPILQYLEMLLDSRNTNDFELFTAQLYLNGSDLKEMCAPKIEELLIHVRLLLKDNVLAPISRIWLLLALDVAYNRFALLPILLQKFYQQELGETTMANFLSTHGALSIETTHSNKMLDVYRSPVSVLKISPPEIPTLINETANNVNNFHQAAPNPINHDIAEVTSINNREKIGRPILGIGARLQKHQDTTSNMTEPRNVKTGVWISSNENHLGRSSKREDKPIDDTEQNKGYRNTVNKHNKGWEHDDRFDTNYE